MNNKRIVVVLMILTIIFTLFGSTLAYWNWNTSTSERTNIVFTLTQDFSCAVDGGGPITETNAFIVPTSCTDSNHAIKRKVIVTPTLDGNNLEVSLDLWINVNSMGSGLANSQNFKYALTTSDTSCIEGVVSSGSFNGATVGRKFNILTDSIYRESTTDTYYLYIWLDSAETSTSTMDQKFNLSLGGECDGEEVVASGIREVYQEPLLNGAGPILTTGMIPVKISANGTVTSVNPLESSWYSYENKEWANMVLVKENATSGVTNSKSREYYLNNPGTTVLESDILAYYVWVPRYKYKIWTTNFTASTSPQPINIVFEGKDTTKSNGMAFDEYLTHPAFTFGDKELSGFWMGKFELTGSVNEPTIKPNLISLRNQPISVHFNTILKFSGGTMNSSTGEVTFVGNNKYGLTDVVDSHMLKNDEWGAVAYLSHSIYGLNQEVYINNSSSYITGRSGGNSGGKQNTLAVQYAGSSTSTVRYNSTGYYTWIGAPISFNGEIGAVVDSTKGTYASTSGNVSGIYDFSGGSYEYAMGNFGNEFGSSGFTVMPNSKYYNLYPSDVFNGDYSSNREKCSFSLCAGQALFETASWYSDYPYFVFSGAAWFGRSGYYKSGDSAGAFITDVHDGSADEYTTTRPILAINEI